MSYSLQILPRAQRELAELEQKHYLRIRDAVRELASDPRPHGCLKLTGREGWRIHIGGFRVVYEIDDSQRTVTVLHIGHRRNVYR